jgi:YD repeat-containing protein
MLKLHLLSLSLLLAFIPAAAQQSASPTFTVSSSNQAGTPEGGTFESVLENVNLENGNVSISISLLHLPGVAGHDLDLTWLINSKYYTMGGGKPPTYAPDTGGTNYVPPGLGPWRPSTFGGGFLNIPVLSSQTINLPWDSTDAAGAVTHFYPYCSTAYTFYDLSGAAHSFNNLAHCGGAAHPNNPEVNIDESNDGAFYRLDTSGSSEDVVYDKSGIQYHFGATSTRVIDPSGNTITYSTSGTYTNQTITITDSVGHVVTVTSSRSTSGSILYYDSQGTPRSITVSTADLGNPQLIPFTTVGGQASDGGGQNYVHVGTQNISTTTTQDTLTLGSGEQYVLTYSGLHEIAKVQYPSGGYAAYTYQSTPGAYVDANWSISADVREIYKRSICANTSGSCSPQELQTVTYTPSTADPDTGWTVAGNTSMEFLDAAGDLTHVDFYPDGIGVSPSEKKRLIYSGNKSVLLRTVQMQYDGGNPTICAANPRIVTSTLNDATPSLVSRIEYDYQTIGLNDSPSAQDICGSSIQSSNVVAKREYGYDGSLIRTTTNSWLSYTNDAPHFLDRMTATIVTGGGVSSTHSWDYTSTGLVLDETIGGTNAISSTITYGHDSNGRVTSVQDARLNSTTYDYAPSWENTNPACPVVLSVSPTTVTDALSHASHAKFDACTGTLHSSQDVNGNTTTFQYDASLRNAGQSNPDGGGTQITYSSGAGTSVTTSQKLDSRSITSVLVHDGIGRKQTIQNLSDPNGTVSVDYTYAPLGGVASVSNPHYGSGGSSFTTYKYDALARPTLTTDSDGVSTRQQMYSGNIVYAVDESNNAKVMSYDSLGRLTSVTENAYHNGPTTSYTYDALNNLTHVNQAGSQTRSFTYNGRSQLLTASNPETGTICYGQASSGGCANGYDANGNLVAKTDARGVITIYGYDALNRMVVRKVSGGDVTNQSSCYVYGSSANVATLGVNRLIAEWTQSADCPSGSTSIPSTGPLTSRSITSYDPMGRAREEVRCVLTHCNSSTPQSYSYDLVGDLTSYNDGRGVSSFTQSFDAAGRLQTVQRSLGGTQTPVLNILGYDPAGWNNAVLGTVLTEKRTFDNRMRVQSEIVRKP